MNGKRMYIICDYKGEKTRNQKEIEDYTSENLKSKDERPMDERLCNEDE